MKQAGFGYYNQEKDLVEPFFNVPSTDFRMTNGVTAAFEIDDDNVMWLSPYYEKGLVKIVIEDARSDIFQLSSGQDTNYPDNTLSNWIEIVIYGSRQRMVDYIVMIVNTI